MKKFLLFILIFICSLGTSMIAQDRCNNPGKQREFKEFKMKFLAQELDLKESQQERFFELYDKMMSEKKAAFAKVHAMEKKMREGKDITDADYDRFQALMDEARAKDLEIDRRYDSEFLKVISKKQLFKMKEAEGKFRSKMHEMRGSKKSGKKHEKRK